MLWGGVSAVIGRKTPSIQALLVVLRRGIGTEEAPRPQSFHRNSHIGIAWGAGGIWTSHSLFRLGRLMMTQSSEGKKSATIEATEHRRRRLPTVASDSSQRLDRRPTASHGQSHSARQERSIVPTYVPR